MRRTMPMATTCRIPPGELEASMRWLEAANILLAVNDAGDLRMVQDEAAAHRAIDDGFTIYSPRDAFAYVTLTERERRMLHDFKKRFPGSVDWGKESS